MINAVKKRTSGSVVDLKSTNIRFFIYYIVHI